MTARSFTLTFHDSVLDVDVDHIELVETAVSFLSTHFTWQPRLVDRTPDSIATIRVHALPFEPEIWNSAVDWQEIYVRKSASEFFTVPARKAVVGEVELLECSKSRTRMVFDRAAKTIDVGTSEAGAMDLVELVRDLVIKDQENRGVVVLHATAAHREGEITIISGSKGAGKSTILLELVEHFGFEIMSGDKALARLSSEGDVVVTGWPDYPHLGYGTIAKYDGLPAIAGIADDFEPDAAQAFSAYNKFAVDPSGFRERFRSAAKNLEGTVALVLHPNIGPGDSTQLVAASESAGERAQYLRDNIESGFSGSYAGWHTFISDETAVHTASSDAILTELGRLEAWEVTGPGDLEGISLPRSPSADA